MKRYMLMVLVLLLVMGGCETIPVAVDVLPGPGTVVQPAPTPPPSVHASMLALQVSSQVMGEILASLQDGEMTWGEAYELSGGIVEQILISTGEWTKPVGPGAGGVTVYVNEVYGSVHDCGENVLKTSKAWDYPIFNLHAQGGPSTTEDELVAVPEEPGTVVPATSSDDEPVN